MNLWCRKRFCERRRRGNVGECTPSVWQKEKEKKGES